MGAERVAARRKARATFEPIGELAVTVDPCELAVGRVDDLLAVDHDVGLVGPLLADLLAVLSEHECEQLLRIAVVLEVELRADCGVRVTGVGHVGEEVGAERPIARGAIDRGRTRVRLGGHRGRHKQRREEQDTCGDGGSRARRQTYPST